MAEADFTIRTGDTASTITDTLKDADGNAVDIQGATLTFTMTPITGGAAKVNTAAGTNLQVGTGTDGSKGKVSYAWQAADVNTDGFYLASWKVTFVDDSVQSFPNDGFILVHVSPVAPTSAGSLYVQVEELKAILGVNAGYSDDTIEIACETGSRVVDGYKGSRYYKTTETRYFTVPSTLQTRVYVGELATLTTLEVDTDDDGVYDETWVNGTDFVLLPRNAALDGQPYQEIQLLNRAGRTFPDGQDGLKLTGSYGWPALPAQARAAAIMFARRFIARWESAPLGVLIAKAQEAVAMAQLGSLDPDIAFMLDQLPGTRSEIRSIQLS